MKFPETCIANCLALLIGLGPASHLNARQAPGAAFLVLWPSARATGLAGAMVALADESDAAYWNPGGLGYQKSIGGSQTYAPWLPGLYPGMYFAYGSYGFGFPGQSNAPVTLNTGVNWTYLTTGETDVVNENGQFLGRYRAWDGAIGIHGGIVLYEKLGLGVNVKYIYCHLTPDWVWEAMPELGISAGGTGRAVAADIGLLGKPWKFLNVGLSLANFGSNMSYIERVEPALLPRMIRVGICLTPTGIEALQPLEPILRPRLMLQTDKVLIGMFQDGASIRHEWRDAWKSIAAEVTVLQILSLRYSYFEDLTGARGGFEVKREGSATERVGLWDVLTRRGLGQVKSVGLCFGLGIGYKDYLRFDISSDAAIYDFPTENWKLSLAANNLGGLVTELSEGRFFDWIQ